LARPPSHRLVRTLPLDTTAAILLDEIGMTYRPMRFDPDYRPFVAPESIYVMPLSADPEQFRVLCPSNLRKKLLDLAVQDRLSLRVYAGCPVEAAVLVREQLSRQCNRDADRYGSRLNRLAATGAALAVLGLVNWVLPDPIPFADELLLTAGGAGLAYYGLATRRRNLPQLRRKVEVAERQLGALTPVEDVLLGRIYKSIRAKTSPDLRSGIEGTVDLVEAESAWLVEDLDLRSLVESGAAAPSDLRHLMEVLGDAVPLGRIAALDRRLRRRPADRRARGALERLAGRLGMSRDALTVYGEFYRITREILEE
jgi:hypothetical protein